MLLIFNMRKLHYTFYCMVCCNIEVWTLSLYIILNVKKLHRNIVLLNMSWVCILYLVSICDCHWQNTACECLETCSLFSLWIIKGIPVHTETQFFFLLYAIHKQVYFFSSTWLLHFCAVNSQFIEDVKN